MLSSEGGAVLTRLNNLNDRGTEKGHKTQVSKNWDSAHLYYLYWQIPANI
jgi:hypothetical protein